MALQLLQHCVRSCHDVATFDEYCYGHEVSYERELELLGDCLQCVVKTTVLEIFGYSALLCVPVLIPIAAKSHNNADQLAKDHTQTYEGFDNLAMGNVEVSSGTHLVTCT